MRRRDFLFGLGAAALTSACAVTPTPPLSAPTIPPSNVPPVRVSADRILKTVVGLRPYRRGGFRLQTEPFLGKAIVHNYGHGGDGVSLSWGCSQLAAEQALQTGAQDIAVIGAGVMGITTALILAREGRTVTLYAKDFPPNTTSNIAGALILTGGDYGHAPGDPLFDQITQINRLAQAGFRPYIGKPGYGVREVQQHFLGPQAQAGDAGDIFLGRYLRRRRTVTMVDPTLYLEALLNDAKQLGVTAFSQMFNAAADLASLPQQTIVNCTGLGAGTLFSDSQIMPIRGQLTLLKPQPEIDYSYITRDSVDSLYMFPRETAIVLGGTHERGIASRDIDPETVTRMLSAHGQMARFARSPAFV